MYAVVLCIQVSDARLFILHCALFDVTCRTSTVDHGKQDAERNSSVILNGWFEARDSLQVNTVFLATMLFPV